MTKLSVNINKLALLRNSRNKNNPDLMGWAERLVKLGVHGITLHPRPDERHAKKADVRSLGQWITRLNRSSSRQIEFNVEGYPSDDFVALVLETRPHQVTLVPDPPQALTSNAGWDFAKHLRLLKDVTDILHQKNFRVSLFLEPSEMDSSQWQALKTTGCDRIELYTEAFADHFSTPSRERVTETYREAAEAAVALGLGVNAGHDLNLENLGYLIQAVPQVDEVSIGHALICEALDLGMDETIARYLKILKGS